MKSSTSLAGGFLPNYFRGTMTASPRLLPPQSPVQFYHISRFLARYVCSIVPSIRVWATVPVSVQLSQSIPPSHATYICVYTYLYARLPNPPYLEILFVWRRLNLVSSAVPSLNIAPFSR